MEEFLTSARLAHLIENMSAEGVTLQDLLEANDEELALLTTKIGDRIRLRSAVAKIRNDNTSTYKDTEFVINDPNGCLTIPDPAPVAVPVRQNAVVLNNLQQSSSSKVTEYVINDPNGFLTKPDQVLGASVPVSQNSGVSNKSEKDANLDSTVNLIDEGLLFESKDFSFPIELYDIDEQDNASALIKLLQKQTTGKVLLEKSKNSPARLTSKDRSYLASLIVEYELQCLQNVNQTIRKDVWLKWASDISILFKGEDKNLYYVPYHVVDGKVIQASGLIHNRLITHRRNLTPTSKKRKLGSESGESNDSGCSSRSSNQTETSKRVRPLPDGYNVTDQEDAKSALDWIQGSSSPHDMLISKWKATFELRTAILKECTFIDYFEKFAGLKLPKGYELLTSDFEAVYPKANREFEDKFPLVKQKLLKLLAERAESNKPEQTTLDLLELASVGEEQANIAALLGIVTLLRQMPIIAVPKKKVWRLSRDEAKNGFLPRVATAAEIGTYCFQRDILYLEKGIPSQPFILAVGPTWENIQQYEIVITPNIRYQIPTICAAIKHMYNMYWALDCAYPKVATPCWMLIQLAIFKMTSKYDVEGVPLRELMTRLNTLD